MLPKQQRLSKEYEIKQAFRAKYMEKTPLYHILLSPNSLPYFRLLIIISKKVIRRSNKRNRVKRKIYAMFDELNHKKRLPPFTGCIIQIKSQKLIYMTKKDLELDILPMLSQVYAKYQSGLDKTTKSRKPK